MTITKEWLQQTIAAMESQRDEAPFGINDDHDMTLESFKLALAGLEAEPVAWRVESKSRSFVAFSAQPLDEDSVRYYEQIITPLYGAPQPLTTSERAELENYRNAQQVVPDFGALTKLIVQRLVDCGGADDDAIARCEEFVYNACRAAMQSGAVKDGWVACSDRLPEVDGNYWGWWNESKRQGPVWFIKSELQAQFQSSEITHWMPLPAAPQQEAVSSALEHGMARYSGAMQKLSDGGD